MLTLLVRGHGRWQYLDRAVESIDRTIGWKTFDRTVLSLDACGTPPKTLPFDEIHQLPTRQGLAANLAQGWDAVSSDEWIFDTEEDFAIIDCPITAMAGMMDRNPTVANTVLMRQPVAPEEIAAGTVLGGQHLRGSAVVRDGWIEHRAGYWLNPSLVRGSLLASLKPGVETVLTRQCLDRGLSFAYWGSPADPPRAIHIGDEGGMGSPGWLV